jgi:hypothetical protein
MPTHTYALVHVHVLGFARLLAVHSHNLYFIGMEIRGVIELEGDIFDDESPDIIAEAVGVQVALRMSVNNDVQQKYYVHQAKRTLKLIRALTFSPNTSATSLSKCASILIAI